MRTKLSLYILLLIFFLSASAQDPTAADLQPAVCDSVSAGLQPADPSAPVLMSAEEIAIATDSIMSGYDADWQELSMQGKLSFDGLPVRPTIKIYMKRGESVIMSARASILGEVARVEINRDSITLINKHTKTYNVQPLGKYLKDYPGGISDIQDILLGQMAFPGQGRLTPELSARAQWISIPGQGTLIYPEPALQFPKSDYGFVADPDDWHLLAFALGLPESQAFLETGYLYGKEGWTLQLKITLRDKPLKGQLELTYPDYSPTPLSPTDAGARYRKVDLKQLLKF